MVIIVFIITNINIMVALIITISFKYSHHHGLHHGHRGGNGKRDRARTLLSLAHVISPGFGVGVFQRMGYMFAGPQGFGFLSI